MGEWEPLFSFLRCLQTQIYPGLPLSKLPGCMELFFLAEPTCEFCATCFFHRHPLSKGQVAETTEMLVGRMEKQVEALSREVCQLGYPNLR